MGEEPHRLDRVGQDVGEGVARREHECGDPRGLLRDQDLREGVPGVVGDDGHVLEAERRHEAFQQPRHAGWAEVGVGMQRSPVGTEREMGDDTAVARTQERHHLAPQVAVDQQAVDEHDRRPVAAFPVGQGAVRQLQDVPGTQIVAAGHRFRLSCRVSAAVRACW